MTETPILAPMYQNVTLVPEISDDLLAEMKRKIRPVVAMSSYPGWFREIDVSFVDERRQSFISETTNWHVEMIGPRFTFSTLDKATIPSFHTYGAPVLFKPSLAECFAAIHRYTSDWRQVEYFSVEPANGGTPSCVLGSYHEGRIMVAANPSVCEGGGTSGRLIPLSEAVQRHQP